MSMISLASCETIKLKQILHNSWRLSSIKLTIRGEQFDPSSFGKRLKRAFSGAKNAEIARILGVSESAVSNYVGGRVPDAATLIQIKNLTNCNLDWLLSGEGEAFPDLAKEQPDMMSILEDRMRDIAREVVRDLSTQQTAGFDVASAVKMHDNALLVLRDWYAHDNLPVELPQTLEFQGWENMSFEEKTEEVKGARETIDHHKRLIDSAKTSQTPKRSKKI